MKFLLFLAVAFAIEKVSARPTDRISADMPDFLLETIEQSISCGHTVGESAEEAQNMPLDGVMAEDNDEFNRYFGCIWIKKGIINNDSEIDSKNLKHYFEQLFSNGEDVTPATATLVESTMKRCENVQGKDYGQKAVKINNCAINYLYSLVGDTK